jgi:rhodanese-related sulfurtransferase
VSTDPSTINPVELRAAIGSDQPVQLVDVRSGGEFEAAHIPGSYHVPLEALREHRDEFRSVTTPLVLVCRSGGRATQAASRLAEAGMSNLRILEGGLDNWAAAGGEVRTATRQRWSLERQVRLVAGAIVATSILVSIVVPGARFVAGAVGAGLVFAALTNTCAMGVLLARLPYNRGASCDVGRVVQELAGTTPRPAATTMEAR